MTMGYDALEGLDEVRWGEDMFIANKGNKETTEVVEEN